MWLTISPYIPIIGTILVFFQWNETNIRKLNYRALTIAATAGMWQSWWLIFTLIYLL